MNGQPCIRGMRLTVRRVVVKPLRSTPTVTTFFRNYPELDAEDVRQALAFAAANLEDVRGRDSRGVTAPTAGNSLDS